MKSRLTWSVAAVVALAVIVVLLVYGTHALTIVGRVAERVF
ncbi:hypothetical protein ACF08W_27405 [Streptomyces sp. NPDC015144]